MELSSVHWTRVRFLLSWGSNMVLFIQQLHANSCSIFLQLDHLFVTEFFAYIQYLFTSNHFFLPLQGIIISSHIKTIEQSNVTIKYRYILKLMIGSGLKNYHPGETILKLSRYTKVVGILDEICLMFRRGPLPRRWLLDDFLRRHYTRLPCVVSVVLMITVSWAVVAKPLNSIPLRNILFVSWFMFQWQVSKSRFEVSRALVSFWVYLGRQMFWLTPSQEERL